MNFNIYNNTARNCSLLSASIWIPNDLEHYSLLSLQKIIDINKFECSVIFCLDVATLLEVNQFYVPVCKSGRSWVLFLICCFCRKCSWIRQGCLGSTQIILSMNSGNT